MTSETRRLLLAAAIIAAALLFYLTVKRTANMSRYSHKPTIGHHPLTREDVINVMGGATAAIACGVNEPLCSQCVHDICEMALKGFAAMDASPVSSFAEAKARDTARRETGTIAPAMTNGKTTVSATLQEVALKVSVLEQMISGERLAKIDADISIDEARLARLEEKFAEKWPSFNALDLRFKALERDVKRILEMKDNSRTLYSNIMRAIGNDEPQHNE